ncbi:MAG: hypothetical protein PHW53_01805 [Patescibacteria group bacterium]|nr:hypothetical protein [Patescibacteria group bacterium]
MELVIYVAILIFSVWYTIGAMVIIGLELKVGGIRLRDLPNRPKKDNLFFKSLGAAMLFTLLWPISIGIALASRPRPEA